MDQITDQFVLPSGLKGGGLLPGHGGAQEDFGDRPVAFRIFDPIESDDVGSPFVVQEPLVQFGHFRFRNQMETALSLQIGKLRSGEAGDDFAKLGNADLQVFLNVSDRDIQAPASLFLG